MIVINWLIKKEVEGSYFGVRKDTICSVRGDMKIEGKGATIHVLNPASPRYEAKPWQSPNKSNFQKCCLFTVILWDVTCQLVTLYLLRCCCNLRWLGKYVSCAEVSIFMSVRSHITPAYDTLHKSDLLFMHGKNKFTIMKKVWVC
jgi:hypothetical protein